MEKLNTKALFDNVFNKGIKIQNRNFMLITLLNNLDYSRIGVIISKRNIRLSTQRNRIRRVIKEYFRRNSFGIDKDRVLLVRHSCNRLQNKELRASIKNLLDKEDLYGQL